MYPTLWRRKKFLRKDPTYYVSHTVEEKGISKNSPTYYVSHTVEEKGISKNRSLLLCIPHCGGERYF
jgi:hypothetical protein